MKEKKLNDEEIIKALENCLNGDYKMKCKGCPYDKSKGSCQDMDRDVLDLIHRLKKENCEQKAKIERLADTLNQYISGELVNEDVFSQQVKDIQQTVKYTAKEICGEIEESDILIVGTQEYGEIEVVSIERLNEIFRSKGVEVEE